MTGRRHGHARPVSRLESPACVHPCPECSIRCLSHRRPIAGRYIDLLEQRPVTIAVSHAYAHGIGMTQSSPRQNSARRGQERERRKHRNQWQTCVSRAAATGRWKGDDKWSGDCRLKVPSKWCRLVHFGLGRMLRCLLLGSRSLSFWRFPRFRRSFLDIGCLRALG